MMATDSLRSIRVWQRYSYRMLFVSLLLLSALSPIAQEGFRWQWLIEAFVLLNLAVAVFTVGRRKPLLVVALLFAVPIAVTAILGVLHPTAASTTAMGISYPTFLIFLACVMLADVLSAESVTTDRIFGALCVYLLLGIAWAFVNLTLFRFDADAFDFGELGAPVDRETQLHTFVYFSFVTLTTLGYGDVTPRSTAACTFAWLEAVIGQLYIAVLIARLVGLHIAEKRQQ